MYIQALTELFKSLNPNLCSIGDELTVFLLFFNISSLLSQDLINIDILQIQVFLSNIELFKIKDKDLWK